MRRLVNNFVAFYIVFSLVVFFVLMASPDTFRPYCFDRGIPACTITAGAIFSAATVGIPKLIQWIRRRKR